MLVGLTGGIGSGKSAAADRFAELGVDVVDADLASRAVVEPGMPALQKITGHFGEQLLLANGTLDRAELRRIVFAKVEERKWLQALLHPLISQYLQVQIAKSSSPYCLLSTPYCWNLAKEAGAMRSWLSMSLRRYKFLERWPATIIREAKLKP